MDYWWVGAHGCTTLLADQLCGFRWCGRAEQSSVQPALGTVDAWSPRRGLVKERSHRLVKLRRLQRRLEWGFSWWLGLHTTNKDLAARSR